MGTTQLRIRRKEGERSPPRAPPFSIATGADCDCLCRGVRVLQNILYVTVNLPDIKPETLEYNLTPNTLSFKAKAGK